MKPGEFKLKVRRRAKRGKAITLAPRRERSEGPAPVRAPNEVERAMQFAELERRELGC